MIVICSPHNAAEVMADMSYAAVVGEVVEQKGEERAVIV
jgi:hypothetical protein